MKTALTFEEFRERSTCATLGMPDLVWNAAWNAALASREADLATISEITLDEDPVQGVRSMNKLRQSQDRTLATLTETVKQLTAERLKDAERVRVELAKLFCPHCAAGHKRILECGITTHEGTRFDIRPCHAHAVWGADLAKLLEDAG